MIDEHSRREMRTVGKTNRERAVINDCGWAGGTSSRKALLIMPGKPGRMLTLDDLREARERLLAESGGTLDGLVAQLQRDERQSDREFVSPKARTTDGTGVAESAVPDGQPSPATQ